MNHRWLERAETAWWWTGGYQYHSTITVSGWL